MWLGKTTDNQLNVVLHTSNREVTDQWGAGIQHPADQWGAGIQPAVPAGNEERIAESVTRWPDSAVDCGLAWCCCCVSRQPNFWYFVNIFFTISTCYPFSETFRSVPKVNEIHDLSYGQHYLDRASLCSSHDQECSIRTLLHSAGPYVSPSNTLRLYVLPNTGALVCAPKLVCALAFARLFLGNFASQLLKYYFFFK